MCQKGNANEEDLGKHGRELYPEKGGTWGGDLDNKQRAEPKTEQFVALWQVMALSTLQHVEGK